MSRTTGYLDVLWPELYAGLDDRQRDGVVWALVVRRAHGLAVTRTPDIVRKFVQGDRVV